MRVLIYTNAEVPTLVGRIEARDLAEARRLVASNLNCVADPRDMPLATFLRRIPRAKRISIKTARVTDDNLDDAMDLIYTYTEIGTDDQNVIDFVTFLRTNNYLTSGEATALLA